MATNSNDKWNLLQFYLSDAMLEERLDLVGIYSYRNINSNIKLMNCVNICYVLLDLVQKPLDYLRKCTNRLHVTDMMEAIRLLNDVLQKLNVEPFLPNNIKSYPITSDNPYGHIMTEVGSQLQNGYATMINLSFEKKGKENHVIILRKTDDGVLETIDAQHIAANGSYPLRKEITKDTKYSSINGVQFFEGPVVPVIRNNVRANISFIPNTEYTVIQKPKPIWALSAKKEPKKPIWALPARKKQEGNATGAGAGTSGGTRKKYKKRKTRKAA